MTIDAGGEPQEDALDTDAAIASTPLGGEQVDSAGSTTGEQSRPTAKERKLKSAAAIGKLIDQAREERISPATPGQELKLFREWEYCERIISQAKQMLKDSYVSRDEAVTMIIKRMGPGPYRYKDKAYVAVANGATIYLRELVAKPKT